jgi:endoglucanase
MKSRVISGTIALMIAAIITCLKAGLPVKAEAKKTAMQTYVEAMQPGWNLGNTFEASGEETSWGNPKTTKELIDKIAEAGFKSIRIPVRWDNRIGSAPDYTVNKEFFDRIAEVVNWSLEAGLYVMINMHHEEWVMTMETQHDEVKRRFDAAWSQIAAHFKDYPKTLMFESINEPRFSEDWNKDTPEYFKMLDELNSSFHSIVRKSGGNNGTRPLVLPTLTCSASQPRLDELNNTIAKLKDKNIIATIHYYGHWPFSVNVAGATTFNEEVRTDIVNTFDRVYNTFVAKGIPVILGEYGLLGFDSSLGTIQQGEKLKYFEYITYYAKEKKITHMLWDNGQHYNRRGFRWGDEELYNVIAASMKGRSSNTERDFIYIKKDKPIAEAALKLNLNGNTLVSVKNGEKALTKGTDYDVSDDKLIIKASLLESMVTKEFGINGTLICEFSAGADWRINVIYYDVPVLRSVSGTTAFFSIPAAFNGDTLSTMEAVYKTGGNAGPHNWTPYKEFDRAFKPDYNASNIQLPPNFFQEVKDGEVVLKMHFWSGEIIEYYITKERAKITGVSSNEPEAEKPVNSETPTASSSPKPASVVKESGGNNTAIIFVLSGFAIAGLAAGMLTYLRRKRK